MKQFALASLLAAAALVGCNTYDTPNHGNSVSLEPSHNFLGIVKVEPASYAAPANNEPPVSVHTYDLYSRRTTSGDRITLLWGAIVITDY